MECAVLGQALGGAIEEEQLWDAILFVPDFHSAWENLVQSANFRANHTIGTLPLRLSKEYLSFVDKGIWDTDKGILLELPVSVARMRYAEMVARLPTRMGGLG